MDFPHLSSRKGTCALRIGMGSFFWNRNSGVAACVQAEKIVVGLLAKTDRSPGSGEREFEGGAGD